MIIFNRTATNRFVRLFLFCTVVTMVLWLCHPVFGQRPSPAKKTIALLSDGQSEPQNHLTLRFQKALEILAEGDPRSFMGMAVPEPKIMICIFPTPCGSVFNGGFLDIVGKF